MVVAVGTTDTTSDGCVEQGISTALGGHDGGRVGSSLLLFESNIDGGVVSGVDSNSTASGGGEAAVCFFHEEESPEKVTAVGCTG